MIVSQPLDFLIKTPVGPKGIHFNDRGSGVPLIFPEKAKRQDAAFALPVHLGVVVFSSLTFLRRLPAWRRGMVLLVVLAGWVIPARAAEQVTLARGGRAQLPIVVSPGASKTIEYFAIELKGYLDKMTGADRNSFEVVTKGKPARGIFLGTREQFPDILPAPTKGEAPTWIDRYRILTKGGSLYLIGETDTAIRNAAFDLLESLGYRHYFPDPVWEIIPEKRDLSVSADRTVEPGFATRYIFYGAVDDPRLAGLFNATDAAKQFTRWQRRNRANSALPLQTGHNWGRVASRHAQEFAAHPEWVTGTQGGSWAKPAEKGWKLRLDNEEVRKIFRQDAADTFANKPEAASYSIEPSDGGGWPDRSPLGSPSDQMVVLANDLVASLKDTYPDKKVAFYAYNQHSPPPSKKLDGNTVVSVATSFIKGDFSVDQLLQQWRAQGAELGIRDYLNVFIGSWDLPGSDTYTGFSPEKARESIRKYHQAGARYWVAELDRAWGIIGLGTLTAMRTLWDPVKGPTVEEIKDDFLSSSFGPVADSARKYFDVIDPKNKPTASAALVNRMYPPLVEALKANKDPAVEARLLQLLAYTRFVDLMSRFQAASGSARSEAYRSLAEWAVRYRDFSTFNVSGILTQIPKKENDLRPIADEAIARVESLSPLTAAEFLQLAAKGATP